MSMSFENPNWVRAFTQLFNFVPHTIFFCTALGLWAFSNCFGVHKSPKFICFAGHLVWRRHAHGPSPSHHVIRSTCMQLLPLVEMYCRWVLQEDCSDLRSLMFRFDSESELQSHELGRSLLFMLRNEDEDFHGLPQHVPIVLRVNPFDVVRERLSAAGMAIRGLGLQVYVFPSCFCASKPWPCVAMAFKVVVAFFPLASKRTIEASKFLCNIMVSICNDPTSLNLTFF